MLSSTNTSIGANDNWVELKYQYSQPNDWSSPLFCKLNATYYPVEYDAKIDSHTCDSTHDVMRSIACVDMTVGNVPELRREFTIVNQGPEERRVAVSIPRLAPDFRNISNVNICQSDDHSCLTRCGVHPSIGDRGRENLDLVQSDRRINLDTPSIMFL